MIATFRRAAKQRRVAKVDSYVCGSAAMYNASSFLGFPLAIVGWREGRADDALPLDWAKLLRLAQRC